MSNREKIKPYNVSFIPISIREPFQWMQRKEKTVLDIKENGVYVFMIHNNNGKVEQMLWGDKDLLKLEIDLYYAYATYTCFERISYHNCPISNGFWECVRIEANHPEKKMVAIIGVVVVVVNVRSHNKNKIQMIFDRN